MQVFACAKIFQDPCKWGLKVVVIELNRKKIATDQSFLVDLSTVNLYCKLCQFHGAFILNTGPVLVLFLNLLF